MDCKLVVSTVSLLGLLVLSPGTSAAVPLASELRCPGIVDSQGITRPGSTAHYARIVFKVLKPLSNFKVEEAFALTSATWSLSSRSACNSACRVFGNAFFSPLQAQELFQSVGLCWG